MADEIHSSNQIASIEGDTHDKSMSVERERIRFTDLSGLLTPEQLKGLQDRLVSLSQNLEYCKQIQGSSGSGTIFDTAKQNWDHYFRVAGTKQTSDKQVEGQMSDYTSAEIQRAVDSTQTTITNAFFQQEKVFELKPNMAHRKLSLIHI